MPTAAFLGGKAVPNFSSSETPIVKNDASNEPQGLALLSG
jgi:hypothetical protein